MGVLQLERGEVGQLVQRGTYWAAAIALLSSAVGASDGLSQTAKDYLPQPPPIVWPRDQKDKSRQAGETYQNAMRDLETRDSASPKPMTPRRREEGPFPNHPAEPERK